MPGTITLAPSEAEGVAHLTLANPAKLNAIDIAMWRELQALMLHLQALPPAEAPHAVVVCGAGGHFAAGGDIVEFAEFRFEEATLRDFHENVVAPALHAMLACDIPIYAQIDGAWYLIDPTWDSGHIEAQEFVKAYTTSNLFTPPTVFSVTHFPDEVRWQLSDPPISRGASPRSRPSGPLSS